MSINKFKKIRLALLFSLVWGLFSVNTAVADDKPHKTNIKTLMIISHPYPEQSVMIKGLQQAAESVEGVTIRNLEDIYGYDTRAINGQKEREIIRQHDRIVFMFPTHWFNITPMMKAYMNDAWGSVGPGLWRGKEMLLVTTAAGGSTTYGKSGRVGVNLEDVFTPMKASALHAEMTYLPPLAFQGVSASKLPEYQQKLIERLEKQLARDLLFRRFVGLDLSAGVPDHSTLWRFRQKLQTGLWERLLSEINTQLSNQSLYVKTGEITIIDASVIQAKQNRPNKGVDGQNTQDKEAGYSVKAGSDGRRRAVYGFKAHIAVEEDGFVKSSQLTNRLLAQNGSDNCLLERKYRNKPLTKAQKDHNRRHSGIRSTVERVFGILKRHYGMAQARYLGLIRNHARFGLICMAYNMKRGIALQREMRKMGDYEDYCA